MYVFCYFWDVNKALDIIFSEKLYTQSRQEEYTVMQPIDCSPQFIFNSIKCIGLSKGDLPTLQATQIINNNG